MVLIINTMAQNGQLLLNVYDSKKSLLLTLKDTDQGECLLVKGERYRIVWYTRSEEAAVYRIETEVEPKGLGIPNFKFFKSYPVGCSDEDETQLSV